MPPKNYCLFDIEFDRKNEDINLKPKLNFFTVKIEIHYDVFVEDICLEVVMSLDQGDFYSHFMNSMI